MSCKCLCILRQSMQLHFPLLKMFWKSIPLISCVAKLQYAHSSRRTIAFQGPDKTYHSCCWWMLLSSSYPYKIHLCGECNDIVTNQSTSSTNAKPTPLICEVIPHIHTSQRRAGKKCLVMAKMLTDHTTARVRIQFPKGCWESAFGPWEDSDLWFYLRLVRLPLEAQLHWKLKVASF